MMKPNNFDIIDALYLLEDRLEEGARLAKQDGLWCLFDEDGEGVASGKNLKELLINLIFMDS